MKNNIQLTFSREVSNQIIFDKEIKIPERLRALREKNKFTMEDVAQRINVKRQTYTGYEAPPDKKYFRNPSFENLVKLADLYNVSTDYLIGLTDNPAPRIAVLDVMEVIEKSDMDKETIQYMSAKLRKLIQSYALPAV
jgi:transcriptional regulator with XRE-family HTH domain